MPTEKGKQGFVFQFMCPGGEVEGVAYNQVSKVFIFHNGTVSKEYNEICWVNKDNISLNFETTGIHFQKTHFYFEDFYGYDWWFNTTTNRFSMQDSDMPHNMKTTWAKIIDTGEIFNALIEQENLVVHSVYTWDNITGGMEIVSDSKRIQE